MGELTGGEDWGYCPRDSLKLSKEFRSRPGIMGTVLLIIFHLLHFCITPKETPVSLASWRIRLCHSNNILLNC